ncbi:MAG: anti-sigma factor [Gammaproteobacteria bacterium]
MDCQQIFKRLDDYLDGLLKPEVSIALERHIRQCRQCHALLDRENDLRRALRNLPAPEPSDAFFDRVIAQAVTHERRRPGWRIPGMALVASIMLIFAVNVLYKSGTPPVQDIPGLMIALNHAQEVSLVFESEHAMENARFTIQLPEGVEVSGYPGQRELSWEGGLAQGKNLLVLPVEAHSGHGGELTAVVTHTGKRKNFVLRLDVLPVQDAPVTSHPDQVAVPVTVM